MIVIKSAITSAVAGTISWFKERKLSAAGSLDSNVSSKNEKILVAFRLSQSRGSRLLPITKKVAWIPFSFRASRTIGVVSIDGPSSNVSAQTPGRVHSYSSTPTSTGLRLSQPSPGLGPSAKPKLYTSFISSLALIVLAQNKPRTSRCNFPIIEPGATTKKLIVQQ
ncbi:hypothetical protein Mapa_012193 [Marchantia paleacea]|nr:hypothetical protein Mapa_012193 [Marchantia paleacea]